MSNKYEATFHPSDGPMSPEEIRNQCEDDADRAPSDLTVWRDRGLIIAGLTARIAQLEAQIAQREVFHHWRVTGDPGPGFSPYDFIWSTEDRGNEAESDARSFLAYRGWTEGPHLYHRTVTRTEWEVIA